MLGRAESGPMHVAIGCIHPEDFDMHQFDRDKAPGLAQGAGVVSLLTGWAWHLT